MLTRQSYQRWERFLTFLCFYIYIFSFCSPNTRTSDTGISIVDRYGTSRWAVLDERMKLERCTERNNLIVRDRCLPRNRIRPEHSANVRSNTCNWCILLRGPNHRRQLPCCSPCANSLFGETKQTTRYKCFSVFFPLYYFNGF